MLSKSGKTTPNFDSFLLGEILCKDLRTLTQKILKICF
jgi:hypothetical protein